MNAPPPPPPRPATYLASHHPNPPPPPSLTAAHSALTSLLHLSTTALHSPPLPTSTSTSTALLPCPFNPNHRLPPSSLFSHYLNCPSPISLPRIPQYPRTLSSANTTVPSVPSTSTSTYSDLCFSLENHIEYNAPANNFFYQNCPGPVTHSNQPPPLLTLPRILFLECSDFNEDPSLERPMGFPVDFIRFLPSEIWAFRNEFETWGGGIPTVYSVRILRAILRLRDCKLLGLLEWVVANSPRYGVIIDFAMRDHVVLLVRLCLKAIINEAFGLADFIFKNRGKETEENVFPELSNRNFECPVLEKVLTWLAVQFGVLYGEVNGKLFAAAMLKESIVESALGASLFPLDDRSSDSSGFDEDGGEVKEPDERVVSIFENKKKSVDGHTVGDSVISISQVAAAVAALHERSVIEEKIRALRESRSLPAYQRNMEHAYLSKIAEEERQKRSEYKPIIEHDGLLWLRSRNQETNKVKTREELLAEERDYKRRRMSYRGKKLKRGVEVLRDIIEEFMEEIKQSGGLDSVSKAEASVNTNLRMRGTSTSFSGLRKNPEISEKAKDQSYNYRREIHSLHHSEDLEDDIQPGRQDSTSEHEPWDFHKNDKRAGRNNYIGSHDRRQSSSHSTDRHSREKREYVEAFGEGSSRKSDPSRIKSYQKRERDEDGRKSHKRERDEHERNSYERKRDENNREYMDEGRSERKRDRREKDEGYSGHRDKWRSKTNKTNSSFSERYNEFEDRYDPAESHAFYEDDA